MEDFNLQLLNAPFCFWILNPIVFCHHLSLWFHSTLHCRLSSKQSLTALDSELFFYYFIIFHFHLIIKKSISKVCRIKIYVNIFIMSSKIIKINKCKHIHRRYRKFLIYLRIFWGRTFIIPFFIYSSYFFFTFYQIEKSKWSSKKIF